MKGLKVINLNGVNVISSVEVSAMVDKRHDNLIRDINNYVSVLTTSNVRSLDFFFTGTYIDVKGEERACFYLTKKGCDMVANKMTGEKGVLFTATYVNKFHEMENSLQPKLPGTYKEALLALVAAEEEKEQLQLENSQSKQIIKELQPKATYYDLILQNKSLLSVSKIAKDYGMSAQKLNKHLNELGIQYKQGDCWLLYQGYADKGYTQSKTHAIDEERSAFQTQWTQAGRLFIYDTLKTKLGILPSIEKNNNTNIYIQGGDPDISKAVRNDR